MKPILDPPSRPAPPMPKIADPLPQENLRDKFALAAVMGGNSRGWRDPAEIAREAYGIADAMLAERIKAK